MLIAAVSTIVLVLLGVSGIAKLVDSTPTSGALRSVGLPSGRATVLALGVLEVGAAFVALIWGGMALLFAAILYLGFMGFTMWAVVRRLPIQSCGCFGKADTPPSFFHVIYNALASTALLVGVANGVSPVDWTLPMPETILFLLSQRLARISLIFS